METKTYGCSLRGIAGVVHEVTVSARLHGFEVHGVPEHAAKECRVRVRTTTDALVTWPARGVDVEVTPTVRQAAQACDLAMAVAILRKHAAVDAPGEGDAFERWAFVGELSFTGAVRSVRGMLPMALAAKAAELVGIVVPVECAQEAVGIDGLEVREARTIGEVVTFLAGGNLPRAYKRGDPIDRADVVDFADIGGCAAAKRALEVAAVGGHHVLITAPAGASSLMLARALAGILPDLSESESVEVTSVHSAAGMLAPHVGRITRPPFRAPHHTASTAGLVGGGDPPRPGEASLAHRGVLVLDQLPEFPLGAIRDVMREKTATVIRARERTTMPADFVCVGIRMPCPCGQAGTPHCGCGEERGRRYRGRCEGIAMDMPIRATLEGRYPPDAGPLGDRESSATVRARVARARGRLARAWVGRDARESLDGVFPTREREKVGRVAATFAAMYACDTVEIRRTHVMEAIALTTG